MPPLRPPNSGTKNLFDVSVKFPFPPQDKKKTRQKLRNKNDIWSSKGSFQTAINRRKNIVAKNRKEKKYFVKYDDTSMIYVYISFYINNINHTS